MRRQPNGFPDRAATAVLLSLLGVLLAGCGYQPNLFDAHGVGRPRPRTGRYATATIGGALFLDPHNLGTHGYYNSLKEHTGIVYTCRAGHVDLAHVRKSADWTAYVAERTLAMIRSGRADLSVVPSDPVRFRITLRYPSDWDERPSDAQEETAREVAILLGRYVSFNASVWHEIITWFGYRNVPLYSEFPSAFSWEDGFSDLLGTHLGAAALRDAEHSFDQAVTLALQRELERLGVQSRTVAAQAAQQVKGEWYSPGFLFLMNMKKRNFDIGLDDGCITPWLVPDLDICPQAKAQPYPVPTLTGLAELGFDATVEIEPGGLERDRLLRTAYPDTETPPRVIVPSVQFPLIMAHIKTEAVEKYGPNVDVPGLEEAPDHDLPVDATIRPAHGGSAP